MAAPVGLPPGPCRPENQGRPPKRQNKRNSRPSHGVPPESLPLPKLEQTIAACLARIITPAITLVLCGLLILWPYTLGFTPSVHRGLPDDAIPIRDPSFTRHEPFTKYG